MNTLVPQAFVPWNKRIKGLVREFGGIHVRLILGMANTGAELYRHFHGNYSDELRSLVQPDQTFTARTRATYMQSNHPHSLDMGKKEDPLREFLR